VPSVPDHPPEAVQEVALVDDHLSVDWPPLATVVGLALNVIPGGGVDTDTVVDCEAEPPAPVQVNVNFVAAVRFPVLRLPLTLCAPLQPPEAAQEVAFVEDHVRVAAAPLATVVGLAASVTVGAGAFTVTVADWDALPPPPVQVRV
jgi:hypothetical protein